MKRFVIAAAGSAAMLLGLARGAFAGVGVEVNGIAVDFQPPPIVQAGRVFVPLRGVFERLGATVVYADGEINATGDGRDISLHIGSTSAQVNGQGELLDVAPFIVGDSTFVPLRFISEALGASVNYDANDDEVSITMAGAPQAYAPPQNYDDNDGSYASYAPPPIPDYQQPYVPADNEIWQPGYWAWGPYGYYWVPGTWVEPPQTGYYWTPGYWGSDNSRYAWNPGYWAAAVGFYGGVNYGSGYYGNGYDGGRWQGRTFQYNTYVTRVNTTIVHNTYVNRTVIVNKTTGPRVSYNGGANGLRVRPTTQQNAIAHGTHLKVTAAQQQHVRVAEQDRRLLATVNNNHPPVTAVARPLSASNRPEGFEAVKPVVHAKIDPQVHAPVVAPERVQRPAVQYYAPTARPAAPVTHPVPAYHAPAPVARPAAPVARPAAPVVRPAPAYHAPAAPAVHPAPIVRPAPVVRTRPVIQAPRVIPPPPHVAPAPAYHAPAPMQRAVPMQHVPMVQPRRAQPQRAVSQPQRPQPANLQRPEDRH